MATNETARPRISWELIGIVVMLALFLIGGIIWAFNSATRAELEAPTVAALDPELGLDSGITDDGRPYIGAQDAPVTVYEFADFQCPHCKQFATESADELKRDYLATGEARLVWVNYPFMGDESTEAAKAGLCAAEQGAFWSMHDWLFANQPALPDTGAFQTDRLLTIADQLGLDGAAFEACLKDAETATRVLDDLTWGNEQGVSSTPTFLVGDSLVSGDDLEALREAISTAGGG